MELALNIVWALAAVVFFGVWLRHSPHIRADRRMQLVALAVLVLILFPVISVTDDLQAMQNPAEADCCLRRDQVVCNAHSIFPSTAAVLPPAFAELSFGFVQLAATSNLPTPVVDHPALAPIQNRPPPVA
jgi:hypothetical protein